MEIWSSNSNSRAFVDFANGYSYLPMIPPGFGGFKKKSKPILFTDLSTVLHEFTHQLALNGPFGWVCSFFQSLRSIEYGITELRAALNKTGSLTSECLESVTNDDILLNYGDILTAYLPFLEGIALFVQLDFEPSRTYDIGSELYWFLVNLYITEFNKFKVSYSKEELINDVFALFKKIHTETFNSKLLQLVFEDIELESNSYFVGYSLVKEIQRILSQVDSRLADPEVYFIFIHYYIFYDSELVKFCVVEREDRYQQRIKAHLKKIINGVVNPKEENLRAVVDAICGSQNERSGIDVEYLDFAALVRDGKYIAWQDFDFIYTISERIKSFTVAQKPFPKAPSELNGILDSMRYWELIANKSLDLFAILTSVMPIFKIRQTKHAILDYAWNDNGGMFQSISLETGDMAIRPITKSQFDGLKREIETGDYIFAKDDRRLYCPTITPDYFATLWSYIFENKILLLNCHDVYVIKTRQRCRSFALNEFNLILDGMGIEDVNDGNPKKNISEGTLQIMNSIGKFIDHELYDFLLQSHLLPADRPSGLIDEDFSYDIHCSLWQLVFTNCQYDSKEIAEFIKYRFRILAPRGPRAPLLRAILRNEKKDLTALQSEVSEINNWWRKFTGNDLINGNGELSI